MNEIVISLITAISVIVPAILIYKKDMQKLRLDYEKQINAHVKEKKEHKIKADVLDKLLDFASFNQIKSAVDQIFENTRADRFLILIAINGKTDFKIVSVIFEQHKKTEYDVSAIARYRHLEVDRDYRDMLKQAERDGVVHYETSKMHDCLLKQIYLFEKVKFSDVRHIARVPVDDDNDVLLYSSLATHNDKGFTSQGRTFAKITYDSIIKETILEVLKKN